MQTNARVSLWHYAAVATNKQGYCSSERRYETTHEEADVILPQQMVSAASNNQCTKVLPDDTNVFVLMANHYMMKGLKLQGFDRGD